MVIHTFHSGRGGWLNSTRAVLSVVVVVTRTAKGRTSSSYLPRRRTSNSALEGSSPLNSVPFVAPPTDARGSNCWIIGNMRSCIAVGRSLSPLCRAKRLRALISQLEIALTCILFSCRTKRACLPSLTPMITLRATLPGPLGSLVHVGGGHCILNSPGTPS